MKIIRSLALGSAVALGACSSFVPVDRSTLAPGDAVRLELTAEESARQVENLGTYREDVQGTVVELDDGSVGITVSAAQAEGTRLRSNLRSYLPIPWDGVRDVQRSQFSWGRTGLLAAGGVAAAWAILEFTTGSNAGGEEPPINNQRVSLPVFRLFF